MACLKMCLPRQGQIMQVILVSQDTLIQRSHTRPVDNNNNNNKDNNINNKIISFRSLRLTFIDSN